MVITMPHCQFIIGKLETEIELQSIQFDNPKAQSAQCFLKFKMSIVRPTKPSCLLLRPFELSAVKRLEPAVTRQSMTSSHRHPDRAHQSCCHEWPDLCEAPSGSSPVPKAGRSPSMGLGYASACSENSIKDQARNSLADSGSRASSALDYGPRRFAKIGTSIAAWPLTGTSSRAGGCVP